MKWFYKNGDMENGPLSASALSELHTCGLLKDDSPVRLDGCEDWTSYRKEFLDGSHEETNAAPTMDRDVGLNAYSHPGGTGSASAGFAAECESPRQPLTDSGGPHPLGPSPTGQRVGTPTPMQAPAPTPLDVSRPRLALFGLRWLAMTIDQIILMVAMFTIAKSVLTIGFPDTSATAVLVGLLCLIGFGFYFARMESSNFQATFGKIVCRLRVSDTHGNKPTRALAWRRTASMLLPGVAIFIAMAILPTTAAINLMMVAYAVDFGMSLFSARNQALHDRFSGTVVFRK